MFSTLRRLIDKVRLARLYKGRDYLSAYAAHTDARVRDNPRGAVGDAELWDQIGRLQFEYLVAHGLAPDKTLLDLGCGTLRGGEHFIKHLDPGGYTGLDISPEAITYGQRRVEELGLAAKRPRLLVSTSKDLKFRELAGDAFDFLLAQSVFTHLMAEHIEECFAHVGAIMKPTSAFFFTFKEAQASARPSRKEFFHPYSLFETCAARNGLAVELMTDYRHPKRIKMARATRRGPA